MRDNVHQPVLGIDLGTTFSAVSRWDGRGPKIYQNRNGTNELQSVVYYDAERDEMLVGSLAYKRGLISPMNMKLGVKRHMDDANERILLDGKAFTPIELSACILKHLYGGVAEMYPKGVFSSRGAVVTVPYYFKAHQCRNARRAAELAEIDCIGIIQEPIAASLMYTWQRMEESPDWEGEEVILVFDLGGGTFDLTLFRLVQRRHKISFEVLATAGDDFLGGMDFDKCLEDLILEKSGLSLEGLDPLEVRKARQKLNDQAIEAKKTLSAVDQTYVTVPFVVGAESIDTEVTRTEFESVIAPYLDKIRDIIGQLWVTSGVSPSRVDRALLVGGSSKIPCMKRLLSDLVGEENVYSDINQSECVATGAALYAAHLDDPNVLGREIEIQTVTSHALGIETGAGDFTPLIPGNRKTPCEARRLFTTNRDNMTSLEVNVYQGASTRVKSNSLIGTVTVPDLTPRPRGELDIEVTFRVSPDQTLSVMVDVDGKRKQAAFVYA